MFTYIADIRADMKNEAADLHICIWRNKLFKMTLVDQELISVRALVFDLAQLTCQKRFDCRNAIIRSSETFLDTS